jgi:hypothetical protein
MQATSGNTLNVVFGEASPFNNTGGIIEALAGGSVMLLDGLYTGTLKTVGSGTIKANNSALLNSLTNADSLQIGNAALEGTINNTGTIQVASGTLFMNGNVTLSGTGSLVLSGMGHSSSRAVRTRSPANNYSTAAARYTPCPSPIRVQLRRTAMETPCPIRRHDNQYGSHRGQRRRTTGDR